MVCTIFAVVRIHPFASQLIGFLLPLSTVICAPGISECGIHAVCIPLDELFINEGDQCAEYHSDVGYISRESISVILTRLLVQTSDPLFQSEGPDAFSQFHLYVCSAFLVRWSEKLRKMDFQVRFLYFIHLPY